MKKDIILRQRVIDRVWTLGTPRRREPFVRLVVNNAVAPSAATRLRAFWIRDGAGRLVRTWTVAEAVEPASAIPLSRRPSLAVLFRRAA